jgi:uncharacterized protein YjbJ (UPF0337 family)
MAGKVTKAKGQAEQVAGIVTGKKNLESKGKSDRRVGEAKEKVGHVREKVEEATEKLEKKAGKLIDKSGGGAPRK